MRHCPCVNKQKRRHLHAKTSSAKLYIYIGVGSRDLFIAALDIFRIAFSPPACCLVRFAAFFEFENMLMPVDPLGQTSEKGYLDTFILKLAILSVFIIFENNI